MKFTIETEDANLIRSLCLVVTHSIIPPPPVTLGTKLAQVPLTPTGERLKLQGRYAGLVRHLSLKNKKKVKEIYKTFGINSAIDFAEELATNSNKPLVTDGSLPVVANGGRHRAKCSFCLRGYLAKRRDSRHCSKRCRDADYRRKVSR